MQVNSINSAKSAATTNFTSRKDKTGSFKSQHNTEPMVKVPYSTLMGLLMLAGASLGTTSCEKASPGVDPVIPVNPKDTTELNPIQQEISDMLSVLGITAVTTKSTAAGKGTLLEYSYDYIRGDGIVVGKINLEESNDEKFVYDEMLTNHVFEDMIAFNRKTFTKTPDGIKMLDQGKNNFTQAFGKGVESIFKINGNKIIETWDVIGGGKGSHIYEAGNEPNSVIVDGETDYKDIAVVLKK